MNKYSSIPLAQIVVRLCSKYKIKRIVICAGSRNAPLTNGFVSNSFFKTYSIVDERAAAFFALGMAQQLKHPVALVCTSGSALLNFYPAIAEAYYSDIPLVILSADRMPHLIDIGDGQTIRQTGVFMPHLEVEGILKPDVSHSTEKLLQNPMQKLIPFNVNELTIKKTQESVQIYNEKEISRVLSLSIERKGPVHLNVPMEEPLYGMTTELIPLNDLVVTDSMRIIKVKDINSIKKVWGKSKKKWVIVGVLPPNSIHKENIKVLCEDPSVIVFTETTSNISHPKAIHSIDTLMASLELSNKNDKKSIGPEILLTFGGMVISKKIKSFLRTNSPLHHWHVDEKKAYNTYYRLNRHFIQSPDSFLKELYSNTRVSINNDFHGSIFSLYQHFKNHGISYLKTIPFSDLNVFHSIANNLPKGTHLQIANSSSIRYTQLMDWPDDTTFFCNRGTSGIDGSTSTAIGAAQVSERPTVLITGDLSFFYDINGLWNDSIPNNFKIILINNNGGGIFRILPGQKDTPSYDRYFETIHNRNAKHLSKAFGFKYQKVISKWQLKRKLSHLFKSSDCPMILEIQTPRKVNDKVLLDYFKAMASNSIFTLKN